MVSARCSHPVDRRSSSAGLPRHDRRARDARHSAECRSSNARRRQVSMPSASTSTLRMPRASMSSLSHSMTVRLFHRRVRDRHQASSSRIAGDDEAADMLARDGAESPSAPAPASSTCVSVGSSGSSPSSSALRSRRRRPSTSPTACWSSAPMVSSERPKTLPTSRMRASAAVGDDGRGEAGALAAVLLVDVLHHLFAPLVLEIDVDVGRLVAFGGEEAAEDEVDLRRDRPR